jgi:dethiobiotin synthase
VKGLFVTGTDTNIGKTVCSAILVSAFTERNDKVGYWKPIQTGSDSDRETVLSLSALQSQYSPLPCYQYPEPIAPARAAALHQDRISIETIRSRWLELSSEQFWIVEGAGGLLVPIAGTETIADLAQSLELPLLIVASPRLGGMNHFILTLEAARQRDLRVAGVLWVGNEDPGIEKSLDPWLRDIPWVHRVPDLSPLSRTEVHRIAKEIKCFPNP